MQNQEEIEDRFTTDWEGPYDERAMEYSQRTGCSYDVKGDPKGVDLHALMAANHASDAEDRAANLRDYDISTGDGTLGYGIWERATRGCKLRTCAADRERFQGRLVFAKEWRDEVILQLREHPSKQPHRAAAPKIKLVIEIVENCLKLVGELEKLVLEETKGDWKEEEGMAAQTAIRVKLVEASKEIDSAIVKVGFTPEQTASLGKRAGKRRAAALVAAGALGSSNTTQIADAASNAANTS